MSGHSKWAQIKRQKQTTDAKRGTLFTKLSNVIALAARQSKDPETNFKLRLAIEQARAANMPRDNIERAIRRGTGELKGANLEEITYEAYGPGGIGLVIEVLTDNKNRALSYLKHLLSQYGGRLGESGSVRWMFKPRGVVRITNYSSQIKNLENFELKAIEAGVEDIIEENTDLAIYTKPEDLQKVKENLEKEKIKIDYAQIEFVAENKIKVEDEALKEKIEKLFNELDECLEVVDYYTNLE